MQKVLIVDDDDSIREMIGTVVTNCGMDPVLAADGQEAIELAKKNIFDLVLMDLSMPRMGGLEATKQIKQIDNSVPIVIISGNTLSPDDLAVLKAAGAKGFIAKPFEIDDVAEIVKSHTVFLDDERRRADRRMISPEKVNIRFSNVFKRELKADVIDISETGMRFNTEEELESGTRYDVSMAFKKIEKEHTQPMRIVWAYKAKTEGWTVGCEFVTDEDGQSPVKGLINDELEK